ncbi:MAG: Mpv17/PMP22 family protein [Candidatus Omnitrophica bacterium]|nr:Mpv17/PMP22 family protein [Candidatus Omnitrophota bacterium]
MIKRLLKLTAIILIQVFLVTDIGLLDNSRDISVNTLSSRINIHNEEFKRVYSIAVDSFGKSESVIQEPKTWQQDTARSAWIFPLGDIFSQLIATGQVEPLRLFYMVILGAVFGFAAHFYLGKLNQRFPAKESWLKKVLVDQFFFTPTFHIYNFSIIAFFQGDLGDLKNILETCYASTHIINWSFWLPVNSLIFRYVPQGRWLLFQNRAFLIWVPILSLLGHGDIKMGNWSYVNLEWIIGAGVIALFGLLSVLGKTIINGNLISREDASTMPSVSNKADAVFKEGPEQAANSKTDSLQERFLGSKISTAEFVGEVLKALDRSRLFIPEDVATPKCEYRFGNMIMKDYLEGKTVEDNLIIRLQALGFNLLKRAVPNEITTEKFTEAIDYFFKMPETKELSSFEVLEIILGIIRLSVQADPDRDLKEKAWQMALSFLSEAQTMLEYSGDSWDAALRLSAIANSLDFADPEIFKTMTGKGDSFLGEKLGEFENGNFWAHNDVPVFEKKIAKKNQIIIIAVDNAGEDIFDLILMMRKLLKKGHKVILAGKSLPALNDSTKDDLKRIIKDERIINFLGKDNLERIEIIDTGSISLGMDLMRVSKEFYAAWKKADLVIFKGQANYFTVRNFCPNKDCFFVFQVKFELEVNRKGNRCKFKRGQYIAEYYSPSLSEADIEVRAVLANNFGISKFDLTLVEQAI